MKIRHFLYALFTALIASAPIMADDIEEPRWNLLAKVGEIEIRQYAPMIQLVTPLDRRGDSNPGFRRLADYIFGGNDRSQKIAMTAPVQETLETEQPMMAFVMPAEYAMEELPKPNSDTVELKPVAAKTVAAIQFSGWATRNRVERKTAELQQLLKENGIVATDTPVLNQYNPPWTLPFKRRNEVMVEVNWTTPQE